MRYYLFFLIISLSLLSYSQQKVGELDLTIEAIHLSDPIEEVEVLLTQNGKIVKKTNTNASGQANFKVKCNANYKMYFIKEGLTTKYIDIQTQVKNIKNFTFTSYKTTILLSPIKKEGVKYCHYTTPDFLIVFKPNSNNSGGTYSEKEFNGEKKKTCGKQLQFAKETLTIISGKVETKKITLL